MDTTRISIAQLLALDVPLTWQDAVAVAQEAAMLSDVHAAMNSRPSLVSPETCFITRTGDLELPQTTDVESPDAVTVLLREMLAGRDAPPDLEALAFGRATRDMSGALQQFPLANRRAEIAKLATRALALQTRPAEPTATIPVALPALALVPPPAPAPASVDTAPESAAVAGPPFVREAPFRASSIARPATHVAAPPIAVSGGAPDAELRRLRSKSVERDETRRRLSKRFSLTLGWLAHWVTWRPSRPDPRILGGAIVITAALVSVVWNGAGPSAPAPAAAPAAASTTGAPLTTPPGRAGAPATEVPPSSAAVTATSGPMTSDLPGAPAPRRGEVTRPGPVLASPAAAVSRSMGTGAERGSAPVPVSRGGITVTLPAVDPEPGPLTAVTRPEPRTSTPRPSLAEGGAEGAAAVFSVSDDDVSPPVMRRQQLPSVFLEPSAEVPEDWPYLELLIDGRGTVEQVRLHAKQPAPGQTLYRHRMLLAAAKAWQFEPARRRGAPVRYVMRVPLEP